MNRYQNAMLEHRNIELDHRSWCVNYSPLNNFDRETFTIRFRVYANDDELESGNHNDDEMVTLVLPAIIVKCEECDGKGSYVNPAIDAGGLTSEDFHDDPFFTEDYFSGKHDVTCAHCNGTGMVPDVDTRNMSKEAEANYKRYLEHCRNEYEVAREEAYCRAYGY